MLSMCFCIGNQSLLNMIELDYPARLRRGAGARVFRYCRKILLGAALLDLGDLLGGAGGDDPAAGAGTAIVVREAAWVDHERASGRAIRLDAVQLIGDAPLGFQGIEGVLQA